MGVDAGDFDNDGDEDLFITELTGEGHNLYVNDGAGVVRRPERALGARPPRACRYTGFGTAWFDFDNDGWLDCSPSTARCRRIEALAQRARSVSAAPAEAAVPQSRQRPVRGRHRPRPAPSFQLSEVGRGAAFGDIDNDGDTDVVVAQQQRAGAAADQQRRQPRSTGSGCGSLAVTARDMLGARVEIVRKDGPTPLAPRARGRQLRVGQRSARARRASAIRARRRPFASRGRTAARTSGPDVAIDRYTTLAERHAP